MSKKMNKIFLTTGLVIVCIFGFSIVTYTDSPNSFNITNDMCPVDLQPQQALSCPTYHQTTNYTCGPAVVMELMRYYGKMGSGDMNKANEMRYANEMGTSESSGTSVCSVATYLSHHGFNVQTGSYVTSDIIISNLNRGIPTLIAINGHWLLAKGYNSSGIFFADSCAGTSIIPKDVIDNAWAESHLVTKPHCHSEMGYYIVATPER